MDSSQIQKAKVLWRVRLAMIIAEVGIFLTLPIEINNWSGCTLVTALFYGSGPCWDATPIIVVALTPPSRLPWYYSPMAVPWDWIMFIILPIGFPLLLGMPSCWGTQRALARKKPVAGWAKRCAKVAAGTALGITLGGICLNTLEMIGSMQPFYYVMPAYLGLIPFAIYHAAITFGRRGRDFRLTIGDLTEPSPPAGIPVGVILPTSIETSSSEMKLPNSEIAPPKALDAADAALASEIESAIGGYYVEAGKIQSPTPSQLDQGSSGKEKNCPYCWVLNDAAALVCRNCGKKFLAEFAGNVDEL